MIGAIIYYIFWGSIVYGEEIKVDEISKENIEKYALEFAEDYYNHSLIYQLNHLINYFFF